MEKYRPGEWDVTHWTDHDTVLGRRIQNVNGVKCLDMP